MGIKFGKGLAQVLHRATYAAILAVGAAGLVQQAGAQVVETKHNLSATGTGTGGATRINYMSGTGATTQVCVFCHTPHGAATEAAPLWQRTLGTQASYTTYGSTSASSSMDAEQGSANVTIGSVSLACLSCHDGTQAMNTMMNTPGSGHLGDNTTTTALAAGTWNGTNQTSGKLTGIANLLSDGKSLQNDHPIGIRYAGGFTYNSAATTVASTDFKDRQFRGANQTMINSSPVWFVEPTSGGTTGTRDKNDIQLYTRSTGTNTYQPFVECASCHDPHSNATLFMRVPVDGSQICLTCHIK